MTQSIPPTDPDVLQAPRGFYLDMRLSLFGGLRPKLV